MTVTQADPGASPLQAYRHHLETGTLEPDQAQAAVVERLEALYRQLLQPPAKKAGLFARLRVRPHCSDPLIRGLYIWGSVGRGKTWLVDLFYNSLPIANKQRTHFHRFMQQIHTSLGQLRNQAEPLDRVADNLAAETRVLCLDEFIVTDIGDAMILAQLLRGLFERGVTLLTTSNTRPDSLYLGGIQRTSFLPAIALLNQHTEVIELYGALDYRLRYLQQAKVYHSPLGAQSRHILEEEFARLAPEEAQAGTIQVHQRDIPVIKIADDTVWFDFGVICGPPRSQADYLEIARCFHTVLISSIPQLTAAEDDATRRFLYLLDEFYDRRVKLIISADAPPDSLYSGNRLTFDFQRAISRLTEMQSTDYLASPHRP